MSEVAMVMDKTASFMVKQVEAVGAESEEFTALNAGNGKEKEKEEIRPVWWLLDSRFVLQS
jgi:hypothetical protein